jgi:transcriptional regulator with XRE-family HTH domain
MELNEKIGKRLKMIRIAAGVKQKSLAEEMKMPAPLLSMYERGSREPSLDFIKAYSSRFGLTLSQFFSYVDEPVQSKDDEISSLMSKMSSIIQTLERHSLKTR